MCGCRMRSLCLAANDFNLNLHIIWCVYRWCTCGNMYSPFIDFLQFRAQRLMQCPSVTSSLTVWLHSRYHQRRARATTRVTWVVGNGRNLVALHLIELSAPSHLLIHLFNRTTFLFMLAWAHAVASIEWPWWNAFASPFISPYNDSTNVVSNAPA